MNHILGSFFNQFLKSHLFHTDLQKIPLRCDKSLQVLSQISTYNTGRNHEVHMAPPDLLSSGQ